jgi:hypothetical protein
MFWFVPCAFSSTNNFAHAQTLYWMSSLCRSYECMNIVRVNIGFFTGFKKIKQRRISFVLGYLRMILWKISTAISIKHRILATFNIKKNSILTAFKFLCQILFCKCKKLQTWYLGWFMVFNATFNNISVISWLSFMGGGNLSTRRKPVASHSQTLSHNVVLSTPRHERGSNSQI